jgi:hypothetical protein
MLRQFNARDLPVDQVRGEFADGKIVHHLLMKRPYSITRGTTYNPARTEGALAWYFS